MGTATSQGYKSSYTGDQIDEAIGKITELIVPTKTSELTNDSGFLTEHQDLTEYAKKSELQVNYRSQPYSRLKSLVTDSKLEPGVFYLLSNYSESFNLLLLAVSNNEFSKIAYPVGNSDCKYVEYDFNDTSKFGIVTVSSKGKITRFFDNNGNEVPFDILNSSITTSLNKSNNCVLKPMNDIGYTSAANSVIFSSCNNVYVHPGCYKINCDNCENVVIMPGVHDITIDSSMNGSIVSYNPKTDTVNVIRD